jgi:hypothetical protein
MLRCIRALTFYGLLCSIAFALASGTTAVTMNPESVQSPATVTAGPQSSQNKPDTTQPDLSPTHESGEWLCSSLA